mgnify:CR=1 FL=1|jgi:23S rRNA G2445 N2-methylase RlmL
MRKIAYYSLLEMLAVISLIMLIGGTLFTSFYRYNRDFLQHSIRNANSKEIFQIRQQFCRAVNNSTTPLEQSVQEIISGEKIIAAVVFERLELLIDEQPRFLAIPPSMEAKLSLEDNNRLVVLTLTEKPGPKRQGRQYRIVAAAGVKS